MLVTKSSLFLGSLEIKPALEDQEVWGNRFVARQGKFVLERSCLIAIHENKVISYDYWATDGRKVKCSKELEQIRDCDTPTSLPSLISDVSDDEDLEEDGYILLNHDNLNNRLSF